MDMDVLQPGPDFTCGATLEITHIPDNFFSI